MGHATQYSNSSFMAAVFFSRGCPRTGDEEGVTAGEFVTDHSVNPTK